MKSPQEVYNYAIKNNLSFDSFDKLLRERQFAIKHDVSYDQAKKEFLKTLTKDNAYEKL